jgi:phospholipid/cholesterol/gamma-HCH transport system ATP-binding protein
MRRRVSIARALVDRPSIVFYDSPTAGLDPVTSQTIITLVLRGRDLQGVTSLLATHRVQDAFGLARFSFDESTGRVVPRNGHSHAAGEPYARETAETNVIVLKGGRIYYEGAANDMLKTTDSYLQQYLASAE